MAFERFTERSARERLAAIRATDRRSEQSANVAVKLADELVVVLLERRIIRYP